MFLEAERMTQRMSCRSQHTTKHALRSYCVHPHTDSLIVRLSAAVTVAVADGKSPPPPPSSRPVRAMADAPIDPYDYAFYERIAARTARETAAT